MQPYDYIPAALVKQDLVVGGGTRADAGDDVVVHYVGWIADGHQQFDSSPRGAIRSISRSARAT
jgi:FKBP-type peptidyl-prolyl cis-trans isomerase